MHVNRTIRFSVGESEFRITADDHDHLVVEGEMVYKDERATQGKESFDRQSHLRKFRVVMHLHASYGYRPAGKENRFRKALSPREAEGLFVTPMFANGTGQTPDWVLNQIWTKVLGAVDAIPGKDQILKGGHVYRLREDIKDAESDIRRLNNALEEQTNNLAALKAGLAQAEAAYGGSPEES